MNRVQDALYGNGRRIAPPPRESKTGLPRDRKSTRLNSSHPSLDRKSVV